jgi:zona occludens toxin (predicted ATPase)
MNQRNSSGLPLRAMVMVLLFLGVVFLLVGFQAMGSSDSDGDQSSSIATSTITTSNSAASSPSPAPAKADVRVFNISSAEGAAQSTANRLREAGWNVTETGNLSLPDVAATTVFFSDAPGEHEAADEVGKLLQAPVQPRAPELAEQPPGVVVAVTG